MCVPPDEEDVEVIQLGEGDEEQALGVIALESMIRQRSEAELWECHRSGFG